MNASAMHDMVNQPVSSRFFRCLKARFFAGLFFDVFFGKVPRLKQMQPV